MSVSVNVLFWSCFAVYNKGAKLFLYIGFCLTLAFAFLRLNFGLYISAGLSLTHPLAYAGLCLTHPLALGYL